MDILRFAKARSLFQKAGPQTGLPTDRSVRSYHPACSRESVQLTRSAGRGNPFSSIAPSATSVSVEKWGSGRNDSLSSILQGQGYSAKEMFAKDEHGKSLIDKVAAQNDLRNPNLVQPGQRLVVPCKAGEAHAKHSHTHPSDRPTDRKARDSILRGMLDNRGFSDDQFRKLSKTLDHFPLADLEGLRQMGVKIGEATPEEMQRVNARASRGGRRSNVLGFYNEESNRLRLKPGVLNTESARHVVNHELGHAMDDLRKEDPLPVQRAMGKLGYQVESGYESYSDMEFLKLYDSYKRRTRGLKSEGKVLWSAYARTNAAEYYAEGMALYTQGPKQRQRLAKLDPGLYQYLQARSR